MYGVWLEFADMSGEFVYGSTHPLLFDTLREAQWRAADYNRRRVRGPESGYEFSVRELPADVERQALLAELSEYTAACDNVALAEVIGFARQAVRNAETRRARRAGQERRE